MAKITPKENFLKLAGGGHPEYVPFYTFMGFENTKEKPTRRAGPNLYKKSPWEREDLGDGRFKDSWGVIYRETTETANTSMPEPDVFILEDITKWRDIIKAPELRDDLDTLDWEAMAKADIETAQIDREQSCVMTGIGSGGFLQLVNFMGFTNTMIALYEEPDEVKALLDYLCSITEPYIEKTLDAYKPDIWSIGEDICTERAPFVSLEMYREFFYPIYDRHARAARERGIPIMSHICGNHEMLMDDMIKLGVKYTEPAQDCMDILALKEKYKGQISFLGCHDWGKHTPPNYPDYDPEWVINDVRATIDKYSPGGAFGTLIWPISYLGDPHLDGLKQLIWDECESYGKKVYGYVD